MKNGFNKISLLILILLAFSSIMTVNAQYLSVYVTDNGSPAPTSGDYYEISWQVVRFSGGVPVQTYTCNPNNGNELYPVSWPKIYTVNSSLPEYEADVFKVDVDVKRRDTNGNVIAGGRNQSDYMNTYEVLNTNYSVTVTID